MGSTRHAPLRIAAKLRGVLSFAHDPPRFQFTLVAAQGLRSALLRHRQCLSVARSILRENDKASTVSIAFVMASTADEWSTLVAN